MPDATLEETPLIIVIADISGYTKFMLENQTAAVHAQIFISLLIESLIKEVDVPLQLQEIEGDAVFLYAKHPGDETLWQESLAQIQSKLMRFFEVFYEACAIGSESTQCECPVCTHADELYLKVIVHSGTAIFHQIGGRPQVSGLDFTQGTENYDSFGDITTYVHFLNYAAPARQALYQLPQEVNKYIQLGGPLLLKGMKQHLIAPITKESLPSRTLYLLLTLLTLPYHALTYPRKVHTNTLKKYAEKHIPSTD